MMMLTVVVFPVWVLRKFWKSESEKKEQLMKTQTLGFSFKNQWGDGGGATVLFQCQQAS